MNIHPWASFGVSCLHRSIAVHCRLSFIRLLASVSTCITTVVHFFFVNEWAKAASSAIFSGCRITVATTSLACAPLHQMSQMSNHLFRSMFLKCRGQCCKEAVVLLLLVVLESNQEYECRCFTLFRDPLPKNLHDNKS